MCGPMVGGGEVLGFSYTDGGTGEPKEEAPQKVSFEKRWQEDLELAYGEMGLLPEQFLEMRPCDWIARKRGYFRKEEKHWVHTRLIVAALTGEKPTNIIHLALDDQVQVETVADPEAERSRILEKYKHLNKTP